MPSVKNTQIKEKIKKEQASQERRKEKEGEEVVFVNTGSGRRNKSYFR